MAKITFLKNLAIVVENQSESKQTYGLINYFRGTIHDLNIKRCLHQRKNKRREYCWINSWLYGIGFHFQ